MKKAHFEFEEIPFSTLARFGLTQEMIEDLPMHVLDDIYNVPDSLLSAWRVARRTWSSIRH